MKTNTSPSADLRLNSPTTFPRRGGAGLTLLEVLIALLVLSIGVVGIGVLHLNSIKYSHSSYYTSVATALALDFEERMWLAVPQNDGCIETEAAINAIKTELESVWGLNGNVAEGAIVLPGLSITTNTTMPGPGTNAHTDVDLTISWTETRFDDLDTNNNEESFRYRARVICYRAS